MKALLGLITGSLLTFLYLQYGYSPPAVLSLPDKLASLPQQLIASSFVEDADTGLAQRQQAIAMLIRFDPDYFVDIDNAIGNRFTRAAVEKIVQRRLTLLKSYSAGLDKLAAYPALLNSLQQRYGVKDAAALQRSMLIERLHKEALAYKALQQRYPGYSDERLADVILGSN